MVLPRFQSTGAGVTPAFSVVDPGWTVGWAFDCSAATGGMSGFEIFVVPGNGTPTVNEVASTANGVTTESSAGIHHLQVNTDPGCSWVVKVTGVAGP